VNLNGWKYTLLTLANEVKTQHKSLRLVNRSQYYQLYVSTGSRNTFPRRAKEAVKRTWGVAIIDSHGMNLIAAACNRLDGESVMIHQHSQTVQKTS
jgi:hypothetical protein